MISFLLYGKRYGACREAFKSMLKLKAHLFSFIRSMLKSLHVRQFAIIDDLELEFRPGFTVITGETGAGKSILVDALGLIFGQRADASQVRYGAKRAEIIAEFELAAAPYATRWINAQELDSDAQCIIRRTINASGGSRAYINGSPVTLQQLQTLANFMIDLHGQHEQQRLLESDQRLQLLDQALAGEVADVKKLFNQLAESAGNYQQIHQNLTNLTDSVQKYDQQATELLQYQLQELEQVQDWFEHQEQWQKQQILLENVDSIRSACAKSINQLDADEFGVLTQLRQTKQALEDNLEHAPELKEVVQMLEEALINAQESHASLQRYADQIEHDPETLQKLEYKLSKLHELARKHQVRPEQLNEHLSALQTRLNAFDEVDQQRDELTTQLKQAYEQYQKLAKRLHTKRQTQAKALSAQATHWLQQLGMADAELKLIVEQQNDASPNKSGNDRVDIVFSANPGQPLRPMNKVASGGELSRIGLALMVASQTDETLPAMIFDEVDAGIGGATATTVGQLLARLAEGKQAFCVTHMAQVAAFADNHLQVQKTIESQQTTTEHRYLDQQERIDELARMLSGKLTDSSRKHAIELLDDAQTS